MISNKQPYPRNITWFVTERCNLSCQHCFVNNSIHKPRQEMTFRENIKILNSIEGKIKELILTGGEPFILNNFLQLLSYIDEMKPMSVKICTNGLMSDKLINFLKGNRNQKYTVETSLDGPKEIHNKIRGNEKSFDGVINLLDSIDKMSLNTVLTKENYEYLDEILSIANKYQSEISVIYTRSSTKNDFVPNKPNNLTAKEIQKAIIKWNHYVSNTMSTVNRILLLNSIHNRLLYDVTGQWEFKCTAGMDHAILYPDGSVSICEMLPTIGNIQDFNFDWELFWKHHKQTKLRNCFCSFDCAIFYSQTQTILGLWSITKTFIRDIFSSNPKNIFISH